MINSPPHPPVPDETGPSLPYRGEGIKIRTRILAASLITLAMLAVLIGLGTWQVQRLHWKADLLARIEAGMNAPPLDDPDLATTPEFTHVRLHGQYLPIIPLRLYGRTMDGLAGIHVLQLFQPTHGFTVLVDRGFEPTSSTGNGMFHDSWITKASQAEGIVRNPPAAQSFENANDSNNNQWYWIDLNGISLFYDTPLGTHYVELTTTPEISGQPTPTGNLILSRIPNNHLQYAITWYVLAVVLAAIYGVWLRQQI